MKAVLYYVLLLSAADFVNCQVSVAIGAPSTVSEAEPSVQVCAELIGLSSEASDDAKANVTLVVIPDTAEDGADYSVPVGSETFTLDSAMGVFENCLTIDIVPDDLLEPDETFNVTGTASILLDEPMATPMLQDLNEITVTIVDNTVISLGFALPVYTFREDEPNPQVCVVVTEGTIVRNLPVVRAFIEALPDGTAEEGTDYMPISRIEVDLDSSTDASGSCVTIPLIDDDVFEEMNEDFMLRLSSTIPDTDIDDSDNVTEITITDDDQITLTVSSIMVAEQDGSLMACVQLQSAPSTAAQDIVVATQDITARATVAGEEAIGDYEPIENVTLSFPVGTPTLQQCVIITVNEDNNLEEPETFRVTTTPQVTNSSQTVTIASEDSVIVGFRDSLYNASEGDLGPMVCVDILEGEIQSALFEINVRVTAIEGTASSPSDYNPVSESLTFRSGVSQQCFFLNIVDDPSEEDEEDFTLMIVPDPERTYNVGDGADMATVNIEDNDDGTTTTMMPMTTTDSMMTTMATTAAATTPGLIPCPDPPTIDDGSFTVTPAGTPILSDAVANYMCDTGYNLQGVDQLTCQSTGIWSPASPGICQLDTTGVCPCLFRPKYGGVWQPQVPIEGSKAKYFCIFGYRLNGQYKKRQCRADGTWSGRAPMCIPIRCRVPPIPRNGWVDLRRGLQVGSNAFFYCRRGFRFYGNRLRRCKINRSWTGYTPRCIAFKG